MKLINGCCLEKMKDLSDNSIDIIISDLPYGRFAHLAWDTPIDLEAMWKEIWRVCKKTAPVFLFGDMKFGVELINSCPKFFKYEIVWDKMRGTTPLLSRKRLGKSTEYVFIFYKKQPVYNYAKYHKIKNVRKCNNKKVEDGMKFHYEKSVRTVYEPSLPLNVIVEKDVINQELTSWGTNGKIKRSLKVYEPRLPTNVIVEKPINAIVEKVKKTELKNMFVGGPAKFHHVSRVAIYEPILPTNVLRVGTKRLKKTIKNITEKPQFLLEFLLKYFSNENDTCLDMCMGSGSMGVACNTLNRKFIGIEKDPEHYRLAKKRLDDLVGKKEEK